MANQYLCSIHFCGKKVKTAGFCSAHYSRLRRNGNPLASKSRKSLEERLWDKIIPEPNSGCWLWIGSCDELGYGQIYRDGHLVKAYRATFELYVRPVPDGLVIDHLCRNPYCVNPDHLEPVSQKENVRRGLAGPRDTCKSGHPMDERNTYIRPNGSPTCRSCIAFNQNKRRAALIKCIA